MSQARFELRLDAELLAAVKSYCKQLGIPVSKLVIDHFKFIAAAHTVAAMESVNESSEGIRED